MDRVARLLESDERAAVQGDFTELRMTGGHALLELIGLVVRRQSRLWADWRPWLALVTVVVPLGLLLSHVVRWWADSSAVYAWLYVNNWTWSFLTIPGARNDLAHYGGLIAVHYLSLMAWSWTSGFVLGRLSRRTLWVTGVMFVLVVVGGTLGTTTVARGNPNSAVSATLFYGVLFMPILRVVLVLCPALWGMRRSLNPAPLRPHPAMVGGIAVAILTLWTGRGVESSLIVGRVEPSMIVGRGVTSPDAGADGIMGTADDRRPFRLLPLVMMWPSLYIVAGTSWRHGRKRPTPV